MQAVTLENTFHGPLDLLLHLVKRDEINIHDIPIAKLTKTYLQELDKINIIDVDLAAEFLDMASRLLEIKSKLLLPSDEQEENIEDDNDLDPRKDLVTALLTYKKFKDLSKILTELEEIQFKRFPRLPINVQYSSINNEEIINDTLDSGSLFIAFQNLCERLIKPAAYEIVNQEISTEKRIEQILELINKKNSAIRFSQLFQEKTNKDEIVGYFIAMLELIRTQKVIARQTTNFTDIIIEKKEIKICQKYKIICLNKNNKKNNRQTKKVKTKKNITLILSFSSKINLQKYKIKVANNIRFL